MEPAGVLGFVDLDFPAEVFCPVVEEGGGGGAVDAGEFFGEGDAVEFAVAEEDAVALFLEFDRASAEGGVSGEGFAGASTGGRSDRAFGGVFLSPWLWWG